MAVATLTRRHFELIARVLRDSEANGNRDALAHEFARELAATNPRFDRERFVRAAVSR